jgi:ribosomal protein L24E
MNKAIYETCKFCKKKCQTGIWVAPKFSNEKTLLFCSKKCKEEYVNDKLERIKVNYPKFYEKVKNKGIFWIKNETRKNRTS